MISKRHRLMGVDRAYDLPVAEVVARLLEFLAGRTRTARLRLQLSHHTSLLGDLPADGAAHEQLSAHIDQLVSCVRCSLGIS